jgi:hypothetical protein
MSRAAILALVLAALGSPGQARAQDNSSCAQYEEPMAYNACLARHGPKANAIAPHPGQMLHDRRARFRLGEAEGASQAAGSRFGPHVTRAHGRMHMEFTVK